MIRNAAAIIGGIVIAFLTVMLVDMLNHTIYPPPPGLDLSNPEASRPYLDTLPIGAFLLIMASSMVAAFVGTLVASYAGPIRPQKCAIIVGGMVFAATVANFIAISHPMWLVIATLLGVAVSAWVAMRIVTGSGSEVTSD
jgi:fructose-specific phosphotransferase system IIC component